MKDMIRIGNAGGYWGDDPSALERQINGDIKLDYITMDFLAEITMSIMQKQKDKDSENPDAISLVKSGSLRHMGSSEPIGETILGMTTIDIHQLPS